MNTNLKNQIKEHCRGPLSKSAFAELYKFLEIYYNRNYTQLWMVNNAITKSDSWDDFPTIRSINTFNSNFTAEGIQPKYFAIASSVAQHHRISPDTYVTEYTTY